MQWKWKTGGPNRRPVASPFSRSAPRIVDLDGREFSGFHASQHRFRIGIATNLVLSCFSSRRQSYSSIMLTLLTTCTFNRPIALSRDGGVTALTLTNCASEDLRAGTAVVGRVGAGPPRPCRGAIRGSYYD